MSHRAWASACMVAAVIAVALMRPITVVGQAPAAAKRAPAQQTKTVAKAPPPPRTPWGDPDLQGVYTRVHFYVADVPFERPRELAGRAELTDAEVQARIDAKNEAAKVGINRPTGQTFDDDISPYVAPSRQTSVVIDPPDGRVPPYTPEAQKRIAAEEEAKRQRRAREVSLEDYLSLGERCITGGFPDVMNPKPPTSGGLQIVQGPGFVAIHAENINEYRLIPVDGRPSLGPAFRQWWGQSRGHWEGNTLVVETTNFNGRGNFRGTSEHLRVVERFTRTSFGEVDYQYTIEDPTTFTKPWTAKASWALTDTIELFEYACHAGNYDLPVMIRIFQMEAEQRSKQPQGAAPKYDPQ